MGENRACYGRHSHTLGIKEILHGTGAGVLLRYGFCLTFLFCLANEYLIFAMGGRALRFLSYTPGTIAFILGQYLESHATIRTKLTERTLAGFTFRVVLILVDTFSIAHARSFPI